MEALSQWAMYQEGISKVHIESFIKDLSEIEENANAELATLRAQLEEAKDVISQMYFAITPNKHATLALLEAQRRAYQYLDSVKSGD
jgi:TolA-binding protein